MKFLFDLFRSKFQKTFLVEKNEKTLFLKRIFPNKIFFSLFFFCIKSSDKVIVRLLKPDATYEIKLSQFFFFKEILLIFFLEKINRKIVKKFQAFLFFESRKFLHILFFSFVL